MRLLLIEDDDMIGRAVRQGLASAGFAVDWVTDARAAQLSLSTGVYDLAILDEQQSHASVPVPVFPCPCFRAGISVPVFPCQCFRASALIRAAAQLPSPSLRFVQTQR